MKKVFVHILAFALIFTYVFSNVGFAVHQCENSGSTDVVSLLSDVSCENIHEYSQDKLAHNHSCSSESCGSHREDCCDTEIFNLSVEQDVRASLEFKKVQFLEMVFLFSKSEIRSLQEAYSFKTNYYSYQGAYPSLSGKEILAVISTWIL